MRNLFNREKTTAFPKEFEDALTALKITKQCTEDTVKGLEKVLRDPHKNEEKVEEILSVGKICEKYTNTFGDGSLTTVLTSSSTVLSIIAKKEKQLRKECHEHVLLPVKVWAQDDYPRFMRDVEKCRKLRDQMESAEKAAQKKNTEEKIVKFEAAKNEFNKAYEGCKQEVDRTKKVHQHHMNCMKLMSQHHLMFFKAIDEELDKATEAMAKCVESQVKAAKQ
uniref:BAR domain-containing protein n=1 Tax=Panagrolaimus sp. ES5 TaxID=591445 RepID=A0AC34F1M2_9BILA